MPLSDTAPGVLTAARRYPLRLVTPPKHTTPVLLAVIPGANASSATDQQTKGETQCPHHRQRD